MNMYTGQYIKRKWRRKIEKKGLFQQFIDCAADRLNKFFYPNDENSEDDYEFYEQSDESDKEAEDSENDPEADSEDDSEEKKVNQYSQNL